MTPLQVGQMADGDDLGTAYAAQAEDINEKLVLDLAWERQQKKVRKLIGISLLWPQGTLIIPVITF